MSRYNIADATQAFGDAASTTYAAKPALCWDGVTHPNMLGAYTIAQPVVKILQSILTDSGWPVEWGKSDYFNAINNASGNLLPNIDMSGAGGALYGATGAIPANWVLDATQSGGAAVAASVTLSNDGRSQITLALSGTYSGSFAHIDLSSTIATPTAISIGDSIEAMGEVDAPAVFTNFCGVGLQIQTIEGGASYYCEDGNCVNTDSWPSAAINGRYRTPLRKISAAVSMAKIFFRIYLTNASAPSPVSAIISLRGASVRKILE